MDDKSATQHLVARLPFKRGVRIDYKQKLEREPNSAPADLLIDTPADMPPSYTEQIRALARHPEADSVSFQCVVATALQTLDRVLYRERRAAEAAISLAQQEKLQHMMTTVTSVREALRGMLNTQGAAMMRQQTSAPDDDEASSEQWWYALSEALQVVDEGRVWLRSIMNGQERGGLPHTLGHIVGTLLNAHYATLCDEAEQWMA